MRQRPGLPRVLPRASNRMNRSAFIPIRYPASPGLSGPGRAGAQQPALAQELGQLDGVRGGALAEVVAHDPEVEAALVRGVAPDAADQHVVTPGRVDRQRVDAV